MTSETKFERLATYYDQADTSAKLEAAVPAARPEPPEGEPMTTFAVRMPSVVLNRVRDIAEERGLTTSALLRQWIDAGVAEHASDGADERVVPVQALMELISRAAPASGEVTVLDASVTSSRPARRMTITIAGQVFDRVDYDGTVT